MTATLTPPYPPSVNSHWRCVGGVVLISTRGRRYRAEVAACVLEAGIRLGSSRLAVMLDVYPPDKRQRDLDNLPKGILDALQFAHVFDDDSQIDRLTIVRGVVMQGGAVVVGLEVL